MPHPRRLAAQVNIVRAGFSAGRNEIRPVKLVGANRGQNDFGLIGHCAQAFRIIGVGDHKRGV